jgi:hypothetical protein
MEANLTDLPLTYGALVPFYSSALLELIYPPEYSNLSIIEGWSKVSTFCDPKIFQFFEVKG